MPFINREIPIIADDYVDKTFGTGCLKVTPAHDVNDYEIVRHQLPAYRYNCHYIPSMKNARSLKFFGKDRFFVRKEIVKDLREAVIWLLKKRNLSPAQKIGKNQYGS